MAPASLHFVIAKYCAMLHNFPLFLPLPATLGIPPPAPSSPASRTPPAPCPSPQNYTFSEVHTLHLLVRFILWSLRLKWKQK